MIGSRVFRDRRDAGRKLAKELHRYADVQDVVVLGLPRGGVPVAYEVAAALHAPLDVLVVRKLGYPAHEELALGAIAPGGTVVFDPDLIIGLTKSQLDGIVRRELAELQRRESAYRSVREAEPIQGKTVILVDDGLATGASMHAAVRSIRRLGAKRIVVAVPVSSQDAIDSLRREADEVMAVRTPAPFYAVGLYYDDFTQTSDEEVKALLATLPKAS